MTGDMHLVSVMNIHEENNASVCCYSYCLVYIVYLYLCM